MLQRHLYGCNQEVKSRASTSLARPHLEYSASVGDSYFKQDNLAIEKLQRKGAPFITSNYSYIEIVSPSCLIIFNGTHYNLQGRRRAKRLTRTYLQGCQQPLTSHDPEYITASSGRTRTLDLAFIQLQKTMNSLETAFPAQNYKGKECPTIVPHHGRLRCRRVDK